MIDYSVTEIIFEEVGITINGICCGPGFDGTAYLDSEGSVTAVTLEGIDHTGTRKTTDLDVKAPNRRLSWNDNFAAILAEEIERVYSHEIEEKLIDWHEAQSIREWEARA